MNGEMR